MNRTQSIWYTARACYGPLHQEAYGWEEYVRWSKLTHLSEVVSLDGMLNRLVFEPDFKAEYDWQHTVTEGVLIRPFFHSLDYVLEKTKDLETFNLLAVVKNPSETLQDLSTPFDFLGYDLIEVDGQISALTNCGGFDKSFLPRDLNEFGLIPTWKRAKKVQEDLRVDYPDELHADCDLFEVWRHKTMGRKGGN